LGTKQGRSIGSTPATLTRQTTKGISLDIGMAANGIECIHARIEYGYWLKAHEFGKD